MKKIFFVAVMMIGFLGFSQGGPKVDAIKFRGKITTVIRDTYDVPTGETWLIHNVTTGKLEMASDDDVWSVVNLSGTDIVSLINTELTGSGWQTPGTDDQTAPEVPFTPTVDISATNVQDAIVETYNESTVNTANFVNKTSTNQFVDIGTNTGTFWDLSFIDSIDPNSGLSYFRSFVNSLLFRTESFDLSTFSQIQFNNNRATISVDTGSGSNTYLFDGQYSDPTNVARKSDVDAAISGAGITLPADDTTPLVQDPVDNTKQVRIDAGALTTATTAVITVGGNTDLRNMADVTLANIFPQLQQFENQTIFKDVAGGDISATILFTELDGLTAKGSHGYSDNAGISGVYFSNNQSAERVRLLDAGGLSIEAETNVNSNKITNLADPTNPQDGATKAYVDANSGSGALTTDESNRLLNAPLPAKDLLITAAADSLYLNYTHYQTGSDIGRKTLLRKNNGRLDLFPPEDAIPLNTVWRLRTGADNDTIAINPFNGYNLKWEGQTSENAAYITGDYENAYVEKVAADTLLISANNLTGFTYTPPPAPSNDAILAANPVAYYNNTSFVKSGSNITQWDDLTANANNASVEGTITASTSTATSSDQYTLDSTSYFNLPDIASLDFNPQTDDFSVVFRGGDNGLPAAGYMFGYGSSSSSNVFGLYSSGAFGGDYTYIVFGSNQINLPADVVSQNSLVIAVASGGNIDVYVDGVLHINQGASGSSFTLDQVWSIGSRSGTVIAPNNTQGDIMAVFDKALITQEITDITAQHKINP